MEGDERDVSGRPSIDRTWWDTPQMRTALAQRDVGALFRWLQRYGWTQTQIGGATAQSQGEVSEVIKGRQIRTWDVLVRIADAFDIPHGLMGLAYSVDGVVTTDAPVIRDGDIDAATRKDFLGAVASVSVGATTESAMKWLPKTTSTNTMPPNQVRPEDVEQIRAMNGELRRLDQFFGGGAAVDAARGYFSGVHSLIYSKADDSTRADLKIVLADLSSLIGWSFHDLGRQATARRYLLNALMLAKDANHDALAASILYRLARVSLIEEQPVEALRMLQLGKISAQDAGDAAEMARLHANEASVYAMLGQESHIMDSLHRAEFEMGRADSAHSSPWSTLFFTEGDYTGHQALVYDLLGSRISDRSEMQRHAETAIELALNALAQSGSDRSARSMAFDRLIIATNYFRLGDVNNGVSLAHQILPDVANLRSARARQRLDHMVAAALESKPQNRDVRELAMQVSALDQPPQEI